jgi:IS30 family transposase
MFELCQQEDKFSGDIFRGMNTYFCHPYHSWEKGTVENTIRRIRRYIPKGTPLHQYAKEQIHWLEDKLNNTPRKCLGWRTLNEAMKEVLNSYKFSQSGAFRSGM